MRRRFFSKSYLIITIFLIAIWIVFSALTFNRVSFSVVTYQVKNSIRHDFSSMNLYGKNTFVGEFQSKDNNLGLISFTFNPRHLLNIDASDTAIFTIREKGSSVWYSQREYSLNLFDSQSSFTFGFPPIHSSKHKKYQFELSVKTHDNKYINVKNNEYFITGYQYVKIELLNKSEIVPFLFSKISGSFSDSEFLGQLLVQMIILICIIFLLFPLKYFLSKKLHAVDLFKKIIAIVLLINSTITFALCFAFIVIWLVVLPFGLENLQSQLNILVYILLVIGCVQLFFEERKKNEKKKRT